VRLPRSPEIWVFALLLGSYAYFWHARDWNSASRLMLTYALVDRGTITLNGLEDQTRDLAYDHGRYYSDKLPGYSCLATIPYALAKQAFRLPSHPLGLRGFKYWPADYWATLGVSGFLTACTAAVLVGLARGLGCGPGRATLVGLAYGLATPAYVYATLSYGHQSTSFTLLAAFALLWRTEAPRPALRTGLAGFLAAYAAVIELQVGPVSAILGFYLLALVIGRRRPISNLGEFALGALVPTLLLLTYNQFAFGSPWDLGYRHEVLKIFKEVHNERNPLGLRPPNLDLLPALLWSRYRGLLFYAPIVALAVPGWFVLARRKLWGMTIVSAAVVLAVFLVNLSYPEWTGGWSTGPRLLLPLLPFAMLPIAAFLAAAGRWGTTLAVALTLIGCVLMLLFQGVGGRIPHEFHDPLQEVVLRRWGGGPLQPWEEGERFTRNVFSALAPGTLRQLPAHWQWFQFAPLVLAQAAAAFAVFGGIARQRKD
jgi:hypothetical protein